jgi:hypothetical protein
LPDRLRPVRFTPIAGNAGGYRIIPELAGLVPAVLFSVSHDVEFMGASHDIAIRYVAPECSV